MLPAVGAIDTTVCRSASSSCTTSSRCDTEYRPAAAGTAGGIETQTKHASTTTPATPRVTRFMPSFRKREAEEHVPGGDGHVLTPADGVAHRRCVQVAAGLEV